MQAIVVYESHWGSTAAIARAIAAGIGPGARLLSTAEAAGDAMAGVDLIVAGAPLIGFALPSEVMLASMAADAAPSFVPPSLSHPSLRSWLERLPAGRGRAAAFETCLWWSPGSSAVTILQKLAVLGYPSLDKPQRFIVQAKDGPLRAGELERAKAWGARLARK